MLYSERIKYNAYITIIRKTNEQSSIASLLELISRVTEIRLPCVSDRTLSEEEKKGKEQEWKEVKIQIKEMEEELEMLERRKTEKEKEYGNKMSRRQ